MRDIRNYIVDKESVYRCYKWKPEDGDYEHNKTRQVRKSRTSLIGRMINLLVSVFVLQGVHESRR